LNASELQEINNEAIHSTLKKVAQALECHINYVFIPEKDSIAGMPVKDSEFLMKLKQLSSVSEKPAEGWVKAIRMLRGISRSELEKEVNYSVSECSAEEIDAEEDLIPTHMKAMAQALGGRFDYVLIPITPLFSQELYKKLERIAASHYKPPEGWIRFMRNMRGITIPQLAKDTKIIESYLRAIESDDAKNKHANGLMNVAEALGGRFECILIPKTPLEPSLLKEWNEIYQFPHVPPKPEGGWIQAVRKAKGLSKAQLARMANVCPSQISDCEACEGENKFFPSSLQKVVQALGGRFEYVLIPDKTPLPRERSLVVLAQN
jgi:transcriptional regulator with XRE-family HTH domain